MRRTPQRPGIAPLHATIKACRRPAATVGADLVMILQLWAIAALLMVNAMLRFPNFGAVIEQYNKF
jgi:hypothetical protein